jgi:hypothetical protein
LITTLAATLLTLPRREKVCSYQFSPYSHAYFYHMDPRVQWIGTALAKIEGGADANIH